MKAIVAAHISNEKNSKRVNIIRKNVYKMNVKDVIVCFKRDIGIDYVAKVVTKSLKPEDTPWPDLPKGLAWIARVKYLREISPPYSKGRSCISKMRNYAGHRGPIVSGGNNTRGITMHSNWMKVDLIFSMAPRNLSASDFKT